MERSLIRCGAGPADAPVLELFADPNWPEAQRRMSEDLVRALEAVGRSVRRRLRPSRKEPLLSRSLHGQNVVVIGGSSGLGAAVAVLALEQGARVIAYSRSGRSPGGVEGLAVDVTDSKALDQALGRVGQIDHLVHTAGARTPSEPLSSLAPDSLQQAFAPKLFGAIEAIRVALPYLSKNASITLTSGQLSRKYGTGTLAKGVVNAAVEAAGRHLAKELAPRRVNVVSPGVVGTEFWGEDGSESRRMFLNRAGRDLPVQRVGAPEELASAYLFAMTNGFATGAVIDVDGGGLL